MNGYFSKAERREYEQRRRVAVIQESRDYRLMSKWLKRGHPDIMAQHLAFKGVLQRNNPLR